MFPCEVSTWNPRSIIFGYVVHYISGGNRTRIPCGHLTREHFGENSVDTLERRWEVLVKMREGAHKGYQQLQEDRATRGSQEAHGCQEEEIVIQSHIGRVTLEAI